MPPLQLTAGHAYRLSWYDGALEPGFHDEHYKVYVSTTGGEVTDFTGEPVFETTLTTTVFTQRSVDLSSYAGQTVHVAFRHHGSSDVYWMVIDDVEVDDTTVRMHTLTVLSSDSTMGRVAGSGTYQQGTAVTITATARDGYHFAQWQDGVDSAVRTVTVDTDATYTAFFVADGTPTYTITAYAADTTMGVVEGGGTYPQGISIVLTARPRATDSCNGRTAWTKLCGPSPWTRMPPIWPFLPPWRRPPIPSPPTPLTRPWARSRGEAPIPRGRRSS